LPIIWYIFLLQASAADDDDDDVDLFGEETEEEKAAAEARAAAVKASSKKKECMPACILFHSEHDFLTLLFEKMCTLSIVEGFVYALISTGCC
jgi:hypothetical protein